MAGSKKKIIKSERKFYLVYLLSALFIFTCLTFALLSIKNLNNSGRTTTNVNSVPITETLTKKNSPSSSPSPRDCPEILKFQGDELEKIRFQIDHYIKINDLASILDLFGPSDFIDCTDEGIKMYVDSGVCKNFPTEKHVPAYTIAYFQSEGISETKEKAKKDLQTYADKFGPFIFVSSSNPSNVCFGEEYLYRNPKNNIEFGLHMYKYLPAGNIRIVPIIRSIGN